MRTLRGPRRMRSDNAIKLIYAILPTSRKNAIPTRVVADKTGLQMTRICTTLKNMEAEGFISVCKQRDYDDVHRVNQKKQATARRKTFWYISEKDVDMALNLEGLRKECGRAMYESIRTQSGMGGMVPWAQVQPPEKRSFEKWAGIVFDVLFRKHPDDLIKFFTDGKAD